MGGSAARFGRFLGEWAVKKLGGTVVERNFTSVLGYCFVECFGPFGTVFSLRIFRNFGTQTQWSEILGSYATRNFDTSFRNAKTPWNEIGVGKYHHFFAFLNIFNYA